MTPLKAMTRSPSTTWRERRRAREAPVQSLASKFRPVVDIGDAVQRDHLVEALLGAPPSNARVAVVAAPAGFGKTTLLAQTQQAASQRGERTFWMNCEETDKLPKEFLGSLTAALEAGGLEVSSDDGVGDIVASLAATSGRCTIFIDQYEIAWSTEVDRLIEHFAVTLAPRTRLVIAGRNAPLIPLAQLQLHGVVRVLDSNALRFSQSDALSLLGDLVGDSDLQTWLRYTEGWPFALQMVRLRGAAGVLPDTANASGQRTLAQIFDYLAQEVFSSMSAGLSDFMLDGCVLDEIDCAAANAIRRRDDSDVWLNEAKWLSPIVLVSERPTLSARLHPLLLDYLRSRIEGGSRARLTELHANAAQLYADRGDVFRAVRHAVQAGMLDFATQVILDAGAVRLLISEGSARMRLLLDVLPAAHVRRNPRLRLMLICLGIVDERIVDDAFDLSRLEATLAANVPNAPISSETQVDLAYVRAIVAIEQSERTEVFHPWAQVGELLADARSRFFEDPRYLCLCLPVEILFLQRYGSVARARVRVDEFVEINTSEKFAQNAPWSIVFQALNDCAQGRFSNVRDTLDRVVSSDVVTAGVQVRSFVQMMYAALGRAHYGMGELEEALACFRHCNDGAGMPILEVWEGGVLCAARAECFLGRTSEALSRLSEVRQRADVRNRYHLSLAASATLIEFHVRLGNLAEAKRLADEVSLDEKWQAIADGRETPWPTLEAVAQAMYWRRLAADAFDEAFSVAQVFGELAAARDRSASQVRAHVMKAHAAMAGSLAHDADAEVEQALSLMTDGGEVQCFVESGELISVAIRERAEGGSPVRRERVAAIIAAWERNFRARVNHTELLTARERDVLFELASGHTTKLIARNLAISPETVKQHLKAIFNKLDVAGRKAAVTAARRRAIIP